LLKLLAYEWTGSIVVLSDALEGLVNIVAGALALYAVTLARRPADANHPYGHGKVEFLSAAFEGGLLLAAALVIAFESSRELACGTVIHPSASGTALVALAALINGLLGWLLIRAGRRANSPAIEADGHHLVADLLTSIFALAGLALVQWTGVDLLDPLLALIAAAWVGFTGVRLMRRAIGGVMDEADPHDLALLHAVLQKLDEPAVRGYRRLRLRHQGSVHQVEVELLLTPATSIGAAGAIAERVTPLLEAVLHSAEVHCYCRDYRTTQGEEAEDSWAVE
jgi:cation diffusion facilitator family transporter